MRAFARTAADPTLADVRLIIVGDYAGNVFHTCYDELNRLIAQHGLERRIHFPGFVPDDDLNHLFAAAQAFVFPSYLEGFGLPVVEAMACGTPVLASDRGSLPEVLDGAGHLFDPSDEEALSAALLRVLADHAYREVLRQRSLARSGDFSWERCGPTNRRHIPRNHDRCRMKRR